MLIVQPGEHCPSEKNTVTIALFALSVKRVLLLQRNPNAYKNYTDPFGYAWELIGGHVKPSEEPERAAKREIEEETQLVDLSLELVGISPFHTGNEHINNWIYEASLEQDCSIRFSHEHIAYSWVAFLDAQHMHLAFKHTSILKAILQRKGV